jgi:hypothetical protein
MGKPRFSVAVVMQRRALNNRWQSEAWEVFRVLPNYAGAPESRVVFDADSVTQWLHPGHEILLHRDEAEGYYLNVSTEQPKVFVLWRMHDEVARPERVTVSYHEGARWMDSDEKVDGVPLPVELLPWIRGFAEQHYKPEPKKPKRYASKSAPANSRARSTSNPASVPLGPGKYTTGPG